VKHKVKCNFVVLIVFVVILIGCTPNNQPNKVVQALDKGMSSLNSQSANFQKVLNKILLELPKDSSAVARVEVSNLLQRTVDAFSAELCCDSVFFRFCVQQELQEIKSKYLKTPLPPLEPHLYNVIPLAIDMSLDPDQRNKIDFYGYDFDITKVEVVLLSGNNEINVSQYLEKPNHYHMTLNLGGDGVQLDNNSQRFILRWNSQDISSIVIIHPDPIICKTEYYQFTPGNITFIPPHFQGDADFSGHGPAIDCSVELVNYGNRVTARVHMNAQETQSDWTNAQGTKEFDLYHTNPKKTIETIVSPCNASFHYVDSNHEDDYFDGNGCASSFTFVGDTDGNDAGIHTKVTVAFKPIRIQLKETGDCVSTQTLHVLIAQKAISPKLLQQLKSITNNP